MALGSHWPCGWSRPPIAIPHVGLGTLPSQLPPLEPPRVSLSMIFNPVLMLYFPVPLSICQLCLGWVGGGGCSLYWLEGPWQAPCLFPSLSLDLLLCSKPEEPGPGISRNGPQSRVHMDCCLRSLLGLDAECFKSALFFIASESSSEIVAH